MIRRRSFLATAAAVAAAPVAAPVVAADPHRDDHPGRGHAGRGPEDRRADRDGHPGGDPVRFATYNCSLNRETAGRLIADLSTPDDEQARAVAEVIQINAPDVLLLNEFDHDADDPRAAIDLFRANYLEVSQNGREPIAYPYAFVAPVNTGVASGFDLNNDGETGGPDDAWGFGLFPGQYGMAVLSRHPIRTEDVRTFQHFRWQDMPDHVLPTAERISDEVRAEYGLEGGWYSDAELARLPLSSKSHWDVPVRIGTTDVHVLAAHPTPPSFDDDRVDRNGRRNHDEIRLWADYVANRRRSAYIYDDAGTEGGLRPGSRFVILGDYNSDPLDGDSFPGAIDQLLDHPRVRDPLPASEGAVEATELQGRANLEHGSDPRYDTADFTDDAPGNLRVDYVLPSKNLPVTDAAVFWPRAGEPGSELTGTYPFPTSDHRLVRVDLRVPGHR